MELDAWCEEKRVEGGGALGLSWSGVDNPQKANEVTLIPGAICGSDPGSPSSLPGRSECWEALQVQIKAAADSNSFVLSHRQLDGAGAAELVHYLRDLCSSRFVDLSCLGRWPTISVAVAGAVRSSLRTLRALTLDGNDVGSCGEALDAWCSAIEEHPGLQSLSLRDCGFRDDGVVQLSNALRGHLALFSVDLSFNRIGDRGVEALTGALTDNRILLELPVEGTDASPGALNTLEAVLERNRGRFEGQGGCAKLLQGLRRARAEAVTSLWKGRARTPAVMQPKTRRDAFRDVAYYEGDTRPLTAAVDVAGDRLVWLPVVPTVEEQVDAEEADGADGVIFEAGVGITKELALRCEAGWRYTATDAEGLRELQTMIGDLKTRRRQERERAEEGHGRLTELQRSFQKRTAPIEGQIIALKEELAASIQENQCAYQARMNLQMTLKSGQEELQDALHEREISAANAQQLMLSHKMRHQEVDEESQRLQAQVTRMEEDVERLERENEVFRRRLHAMRFETEAERFVPRQLNACAVQAAATAKAVTVDC